MQQARLAPEETVTPETHENGEPSSKPSEPPPTKRSDNGGLTVEAGEAILMTVDSDGDGFANGLDNCPGVVNPDQIDTDGNGFGDVCEPSRDNVDLSVDLAFSRNPARVNRTMTLRMSVSNKGDTASGPVTAELALPEEVRFLAVASRGPWRCTVPSASGRITCTVNDMEPGATKTAVLSVKPSQAGILTFWFRAEAEPLEADFENNKMRFDLTAVL
ncbi:hypothetical protein F0U59_22540 [Archangium gephyra]|nr:hypothetical protein F0U59_22540 [Archangium gephyra]